MGACVNCKCAKVQEENPRMENPLSQLIPGLRETLSFVAEVRNNNNSLTLIASSAGHLFPVLMQESNCWMAGD